MNSSSSYGAAPWHKLYPPNSPHDIDPHQYNSLIDLFAQSVTEFGERPAFANFNSYLSYQQTNELVHQFAAYLAVHCGVSVGDRVAIMLPNILAYPIAMLGALHAGAVVVNVNPQYTARELEHQLADSNAKILVTLRQLLPLVGKVIAGTELQHIVHAEVGDLLKCRKRILINAVMRWNGQRIADHGGNLSFRKALRIGHACKFQTPSIGHNNLAFLQYTGGTTGPAKGAMLTHGNIIANVLQMSAFFADRVEPGDETVITALPLYHIYALTFNCFTFLHHGGLNYLITDPRNIRRFIKELRHIRFTAISGVNTLYKQLLDNEAFQRIDFSHLKYASSGGMATQSAVAALWQTQTGVILAQSYGLTEASPAVCTMPPDVEEFNGSVGIPLPSTDCSIRDENGTPRAPNESGELWVRGPQVMLGYWNQPEETENTLSEDGWLKTGDIAKMDERGFITIVDRLKDMIIVSGFNVYPNEVEEIVAGHPGIDEAAVIGLPDENSGEAVVLVAVKNDPSLTEQELIEYCRSIMASYKKPSRVIFATALPKSNVGKILRREVRAMFDNG